MGFQFTGRGRWTATASCFALALLAASPARGQAGKAVLTGLLYHDSTGAPVRGTVMLVEPSTNGPVARVVTDSAARSRSRWPPASTKSPRCGMGSRPAVAPITLQSGERMTVNVPIAVGDARHRIAIVNHTRADAQPAPDSREALASLVQTGGFASRRARHAPGHSYDRGDLERSGAHTLGEFLQHTGAMRITDVLSAGSMQMSRSATYAIPGSPSPLAACHVGWFVDAHRMDFQQGIDASTDALPGMDLNLIEGVEVFRGLSEMPPEFADPDLRCGAILSGRGMATDSVRATRRAKLSPAIGYQLSAQLSAIGGYRLSTA